MAQPALSAHFQQRQPSDIRVAQIRFAERRDGTEAINVALGNVSLPMHPAMVERMANLGAGSSPFHGGVVKYTQTVGLEETRQAFLNVIAGSGFGTDRLFCQVTDGGSQGMELVVTGCCGPAGSGDRPLLLIDPAYTNYKAFAGRLGRRTVSITRRLQEDGKFTLPALAEIEAVIREHRPGALVVIPYDNPTGQFYGQELLTDLARLCVEHGLWLVSDEAYRELFYTAGDAISVWGLSEDVVPGITGRRISIETASKVWNACGLRIGGLVTDSRDFHEKAVAENTASLCSNTIGQYIFGALASQTHLDLQVWFDRQRKYYQQMLVAFTGTLRKLLPGVIVSSPDAAIYSVVDFRNIASRDFDAREFVLHCAAEGRLDVAGRPTTLLTAPMAGFYNVPQGSPNPGRTQVRVAYTEPPARMELVPHLLAKLFRIYEAARP